MTREHYLAVDVGTGSVRAAIVDAAGSILAVEQREHDQIVPAFGWSEQRPLEWWEGVAAATRAVLGRCPDAARGIAAVSVCGQMHATVLLGDDGRPTRETAPLWNDKRTAGHVARFEAAQPAESYLAETANMPTPAWPAFKLQWLRDEDPDAYRRAAVVLMPKDWINFRLTGEVATDPTEASLSFLADAAEGGWSAGLAARLGLEAGKLPPIRPPHAILGGVTAAAAAETGLAAGTPVIVGAGDFPVALLGSGVTRPGVGSDVTGTSSIVTVVAAAPVRDEAVCNMRTVDGRWASFALLESGGDAMRWARRAFHDKALSYADIVDRAGAAPAGADGLFFLPYLAGERLGRHRNARAQFFGLAAGHGLPHLHRAIMEGVAFASTRHLRLMQAAAGRPLERIVAAGGGTRTRLWMRIKASAYGLPILLPAEAECGLVGCAALAATATGRFAHAAAAADVLVRFAEEIAPEPSWMERYRRMQPLHDRLYQAAQAFYDDLDQLAEPFGR